MSETPQPSHDHVPSPWLVPTLATATFMAMLQAMALSPILPVVADDLDVSISLLGQVPAASMFMAALIGFTAGPLADRFGHTRTLLGSLIAIIISTVGMTVAPGFALLLIAALIGSAGRAIVQPVSVVIVGERYHGDQQRRAVSWVMAGVSGAVIAGIPVITTIADLFGWRTSLGTLAVVIILLFPIVRRSVLSGPQPEAAPIQTTSSWRAITDAYQPLMRHSPSVALIVSTMLSSSGIWVMATYMGAFYDDQYGLATQQIGWIYVVPGVTLFAGSLLAGGRVGSLPLRPIVVATRFIAGVTIAGVLILPIPVLAGVSLLGIQGLATGIANTTVVFLLLRESPTGRATTMTLNTVGLSLGTAFGGMIGGSLLAFASYASLGVASLILATISSALVWRFGSTPETGMAEAQSP